ncbi:MAG: NAD(P)H-hydrate dehydratase [Thiotrichales bacterium]
MLRSPVKLLTAAQIRAIEQRVIESGIPGCTLVTRAGRALFNQAVELLPPGGKACVLCGPGNNGGDGYVLARLLAGAGYELQVLSIAVDRKPSGDAARALSDWIDACGEIATFNGQLPADADLIVDAVFGIGLERPLIGMFRSAVEAMNNHSAPVLSVDIPSGIHADTGAALGVAVKADVTLTFLAWKLGLFLDDAVDHRGQLMLDTLDIELDDRDLEGAITLLARQPASTVLPPRHRNSHKGLFGHVVIVGGDVGMSGAVRMAGEAALRIGAGLVTLLTHPAHAASVNLGRPELMSYPVSRTEDIAALLLRATVVGVGPGMVDDSWSRMCWQAVRTTDCPLVVDAGALKLLAEEPDYQQRRVLTPHPGEAARLLGCQTSEVQADRPAASRALQQRYGGVAVLKGAGTLVATANGLTLCNEGNPGMATGGMGDVLTGVIAGLVAQGLALDTATKLGVQLHARAGDLAAGEAPRGLLATDLMPRLRELMNE